MMLARRTIKDVEALLTEGNYTRAASLAVKLSDDPLVALLARELTAVGNKNRNGRGPRKADKIKVLNSAGKFVEGITFNELGAGMLYADLIRARDIVDGRTPVELMGATDVNSEEEARALLRKHNLHKVTRQQFRAQARTAAVKAYGVPEEKFPR